MSTAQGYGIATPYTHHDPSLSRTVCAVAVSVEGIDFDSIDGKPVHLFFMVIAPDGGAFLRVIEHLIRRMKDDTLRESLKQAKTREAIFALLEEDDSSEGR